MAQDFLSDVELYVTDQPVGEGKILITGNEAHHLVDVMRHKVGDDIYISDGRGSVYNSEIISVEKDRITAIVKSVNQYDNKFAGIWFCIPRLKSADRFEFALEKCVELGITNFIVFDSKRTVAKGEKIERWEKILLSAMKQSLRAWKPLISYEKSVESILTKDGVKIYFDQNAETSIHSFLPVMDSQFGNTDCFFIFGPEGGLTEEELNFEQNSYKIKLTENRLRSETAIISAASALAMR